MRGTPHADEIDQGLSSLLLKRGYSSNSLEPREATKSPIGTKDKGRDTNDKNL